MWHRVSTALPVAASTGHQSAQIGRQAPLDFLIALLNCVGCTTSICLLELLANVFVGLLPRGNQGENGGGDLDFEAAGSGVMIVADLQLCKFFRRLFELIGCRYERRSMLITANQPFGEWGKVFPDQAMTLAAIDRLVRQRRSSSWSCRRRLRPADSVVCWCGRWVHRSRANAEWPHRHRAGHLRRPGASALGLRTVGALR
jgi:hypothetical protein